MRYANLRYRTQKKVARYMKADSKNNNYILFCSILSITLIIAFMASFLCGRYSSVNILDLLHMFSNKLFSTDYPIAKNTEAVILQLRLPRILGACLIGAALALSGTAYQALFGNPIASPDILGVSNAASFAAVLGIVIGANDFVIKLLAFCIGTLTVLGVFGVATKVSKGRNLTTYLLLVGMVVSSVFSALLSILKYVADPDNQLPQITYWLMGSLSKVTNQDIKLFALFFLVGSIPLLFLRWRMNLLSLSETEAKSVGDNVFQLRAIIIICATLLTAAATSLTGGISWVGLIIPHIVRRIVGTDFRKVIPASCLLGATFLLVMDDLARSISINELPISILTSLVGAPIFFIIILFNRSQIENDN